MDELDSKAGTVNPQITDAVTQTNTKVVGQAPAQAIAQVFQSIAHATGLMVENAVNAQNQQCIISSSVVTQGAIYLFSQNAESTAHPGPPVAGVARGTQAGASESANLGADVQKSALQLKQLAANRSAINAEVLASVDAAHQYTLGSADAFAHGLRVSIQAFVEGLEGINAAEYQQQMQAIRIAATAVCLDAMLKSPERAKDYAGVFELIQQLA